MNAPGPPSPYGRMDYAPRPLAAFVLSLVGGVLILLGGVFELWIGSVISGTVFVGNFGTLFVLLGLIGVVVGVLVVTLSVLLYLHPQHHVVCGVLILVLSIVSIASYWGFLVGLVLGIVGGILAITWRPYPWAGAPYAYSPPGTWAAGPPPWAPPAQRVCLKCGRLVGLDLMFCPHCGNQLGA